MAPSRPPTARPVPPRPRPVAALPVVLMAGLAVAPLGSGQAANPAPEPSASESLFRTYCQDCHNADRKRGGLDLQGLLAEPRGRQDDWQRVREALREGDMPPEDEGRQPLASERSRMLDLTAHRLAVGAAGRPQVRRLTRIEYNNTLRDLLGLASDLLPVGRNFPDPGLYMDPASGRIPVAFTLQTDVKRPGPWLRLADLPVDRRAEHGYSNQVDVLGVSPLLFERYLEIAQVILSRAATEDLRGPLARGVAAMAAEEVDQPPAAIAGARLSALAPLLFRRPVDAGTLSPYVALATRALDDGASLSMAMQQAAAAMLASPRFLFRMEGSTATGARALDDWQLATRLSYFLWSTMPDEALRRAAARGELQRPEGLARQVQRMLRDPRVTALGEVFAYEWLGLDKLVGARPDPRQFPTYYWGELNKHSLAGPMAFEDLLLFETILVEGRSVLEFLDAPYAYLNPILARHYGVYEAHKAAFASHRERTEVALLQAFEARIAATKPKKPQKPPKADENAIWMRCNLPGRQRGGVLTSGAILTLTSGPHRTSPVKRGVWMLETIFNRPPPPPPAAAVPPLGETEGESASIPLRTRLERHRSDPACAGCHARIDPLGFALAGFDAIGAVRTSEAGMPVDVNFVLPDGHAGAGIIDLKDRLLAEPRAFVRGLVEHLLMYATGRPRTAADEAAIEEIVNAAAKGGFKLPDLITAIVLSRPFRFAEAHGAEEAS